jgi:hypothetical protein
LDVQSRLTLSIQLKLNFSNHNILLPLWLLFHRASIFFDFQILTACFQNFNSSFDFFIVKLAKLQSQTLQEFTLKCQRLNRLEIRSSTDCDTIPLELIFELNQRQNHVKSL